MLLHLYICCLQSVDLAVYPLRCCSYGTPGDIIGSVEVTSEDLDDDKPGPVANILSYYDNTKFWWGRRESLLPINATFYLLKKYY